MKHKIVLLLFIDIHSAQISFPENCTENFHLARRLIMYCVIYNLIILIMYMLQKYSGNLFNLPWKKIIILR